MARKPSWFTLSFYGIVDNDSFDERGALTFASERTRKALGEPDTASFQARTARDGVVTGFATIDGRPVSIGVFGGTVNFTALMDLVIMVE